MHLTENPNVCGWMHRCFFCLCILGGLTPCPATQTVPDCVTGATVSWLTVGFLAFLLLTSTALSNTSAHRSWQRRRLAVLGMMSSTVLNCPTLLSDSFGLRMCDFMLSHACAHHIPSPFAILFSFSYLFEHREEEKERKNPGDSRCSFYSSPPYTALLSSFCWKLQCISLFCCLFPTLLLHSSSLSVINLKQEFVLLCFAIPSWLLP